MSISQERRIVINRPEGTWGEVRGGSIDKPFFGIGDYYDIVETIINRGECIYVGFNEGIIFIDTVNKIMTAEAAGIKNLEDAAILILQAYSLTQHFDYSLKINDELQGLRYPDRHYKV